MAKGEESEIFLCLESSSFSPWSDKVTRVSSLHGFFFLSFLKSARSLKELRIRDSVRERKDEVFVFLVRTEKIATLHR